MEDLITLLNQNKQWIFSGIGVTILGLFFRKKITPLIKNNLIAKNRGLNIAIGDDSKIENIQTQKTGDFSTSIQVNGDYISGITYKDARSIALDVFKANAQIYTDTALQTINNRAAEITDELFKMIYADLPEKLEKLIEPSIQEAILNSQKAYAKNDSKILKQQLIELMRQRLQTDESNIEQIILDEALTILPKLTSKHMDVLSLHFSIIRLRRNNINSRPSFFHMIENDVLPFLFEGFTASHLYEHLQYTGCTTILSEGSTYKPPEELYYNNYNGLFNTGFTREEFDEYMKIDTTQFNEIITVCQLDSTRFQLDALNVSVLENQINKYNFEQHKDKLLQYFNQTTMSMQEMKEDIIKNYSQFKTLSESWGTSRSFKALSLTSVGLAISILNFNIKTGNNVSLKDFLDSY